MRVALLASTIFMIELFSRLQLPSQLFIFQLSRQSEGMYDGHSRLPHVPRFLAKPWRTR